MKNRHTWLSPSDNRINELSTSGLDIEKGPNNQLAIFYIGTNKTH